MERRLRTFYLKRRRYRIAANVVTVVGAAAGVIVTAAMWPAGPGPTHEIRQAQSEALRG